MLLQSAVKTEFLILQRSEAVLATERCKNQTSFQITGCNAKMYLKECIEFYNSCEYVYWNEIIELYEKYKEVEKLRSSNKATVIQK